VIKHFYRFILFIYRDIYLIPFRTFPIKFIVFERESFAEVYPRYRFSQHFWKVFQFVKNMRSLFLSLSLKSFKIIYRNSEKLYEEVFEEKFSHTKVLYFFSSILHFFCIFFQYLFFVKGMLDWRSNLNYVDNTDISNSELKIKWQG